MHSFNANSDLLISAPSSLVCLSAELDTAPRSLPARSISENLPGNIQVQVQEHYITEQKLNIECINTMEWPPPYASPEQYLEDRMTTRRVRVGRRLARGAQAVPPVDKVQHVVNRDHLGFSQPNHHHLVQGKCHLSRIDSVVNKSVQIETI